MTPRILRDACVPQRLRRDLAAAGNVDKARYAGLEHLTNGALLRSMSGRFDVLVTTDTNLRYQQSLVGRLISVIVLRAKSNDISHLRPLMPGVATALLSLQPGTVIEVR